MITIVKHEWHQVDAQFAYELTEETLAEIYPDLDEEEIQRKLQEIADGKISVEEIIDDAYNEGVDIEWDRQYDDWWTDRKGGYEVTYELGDEDSWHAPDTPPDPAYKCTKCRWTGGLYETLTQYHRADGSLIDSTSDEDADHTSEVCPMCDSAVELTPSGLIEEEARKKRMAEFEIMMAELDDEEDE